MLASETNSYLRLPGVDQWDDGTYVGLSITNGAGETVFLGPSLLSVYPLAIHIPGGSTNSMGPAERYPATVNVRGEPTNGLSRVEVTLQGLRHAYPGDLDVLLVSPSGAEIMLMSHAGGSMLVSNATLVFHPASDGYPIPPQSGPIPSNATTGYSIYNYGDPETQMPGAPPAPYPGTLDLLPSTDPSPNGLWKLYIYDHKSGGTGVLQDSWSLNFYY